jgi:hypothetical protein
MLVHRFFKKDRAVMFDLVGRLELKATSKDSSVLAALEHAAAYASKTRDFIPAPSPLEEGDPGSGMGFASGNWRRAVSDRRHPGMVARRHFEAMVFTYLAEELRTGDIAVVGSNEYADWSEHLLPWEQCEPLLETFCERVGLPATATGFVDHLRDLHLDAAAHLEAGYADNADLIIIDGVPTLKKRRSAGTSVAAELLARAIERRMPERSLLGMVARTAYWLGWWRRFGPANEPTFSAHVRVWGRLYWPPPGRHGLVEVGQRVVGNVHDLEGRVIAAGSDDVNPAGHDVGLTARASAANDDRHLQCRGVVYLVDGGRFGR